MKKGVDVYGGIYYMNRKNKIKATREKNAEKVKEEQFNQFIRGLGETMENLCEDLCLIDKN